MIKKIKIVNNEGVWYLRDTTVGEIYDITSFTKTGGLDACGEVAKCDTLNFIDDVGENVSLFVNLYEVVEEE